MEASAGMRSARTAWAGLLIAVFGPALAYTDLWDGGHSVFKFTALLLGAGVAALGVAMARPRSGAPRPHVVDLFVGGYVVWTGAATALAPEPLLSFTGSRPYWDGLASALAAGTVYFIARWLVASQKHSGRALATGAAATSIALALAMTPAYLGAPGFASLLRAGRAGSLMGQPTFLAGFALAWLPILTLASRAAWRSHRRDLRAHALRWGAPAAVLLLFATLSRSGWLGAAVATALWFVLSAPDTRKRIVRGVAVVSVAAVLIGALVMTRQGGDSFGTRMGAWSYAFQATAEQPLQGSGPGTYVYSYLRSLTPGHYKLEPATVLLDPHNWYLNSSSTTGAAGGLLAAGIAVSSLVVAFRLRSVGGPALAAACGAAGYFVHCIFTPNSIATFPSALVLMALAVAEVQSKDQDSQHPPRRLLNGWTAGLVALIGVALMAASARSAAAESAYAVALLRNSSAASELANTLAPEVSTYALQRAHMLIQADEPLQAIRILESARSTLPRDARLATDAGGIAELVAMSVPDEGTSELAREWLEEGVEAAPADPRSRFAYAAALVRRGDQEAASEQLAVLKRQYGPSDRYVGRLERLLE